MTEPTYRELRQKLDEALTDAIQHYAEGRLGMAARHYGYAAIRADNLRSFLIKLEESDEHLERTTR